MGEECAKELIEHDRNINDDRAERSCCRNTRAIHNRCLIEATPKQTTTNNEERNITEINIEIQRSLSVVRLSEIQTVTNMGDLLWQNCPNLKWEHVEVDYVGFRLPSNVSPKLLEKSFPELLSKQSVGVSFNNFIFKFLDSHI